MVDRGANEALHGLGAYGSDDDDSRSGSADGELATYK